MYDYRYHQYPPTAIDTKDRARVEEDITLL